MKTSSVPIACGTALALMAGAAAAHWLSVRDMVTLATLLPQQAPAPATSHHDAAMLAKLTAPQPLPDDSVAREAKSTLAAARKGQPQPLFQPQQQQLQPVSAPAPANPNLVASRIPATANSTEEKLLRHLEDILAQNQELRDRVADTNRDMMELRLQVDSYHGQFRPLKVEEEPRYFDDSSGGVLPPLDAP
ncbi:hypothetical protein [Haloferula sp. BvORR071]|uniref:hypothetical protein n=1 Tax=Haloferula sp. BvORR071 TaxID=1396141 RepID=UPI0005593E66|nr:hypothetical protein [Haloferula sp. BvORR071]